LHIPDYAPDEWVERYGTGSKPTDVKVRRRRAHPDAVALAGALAVLVGTLVALVVSAPQAVVAAGALATLLVIAAVASTVMTHAILHAGS
jgi:hypothetical protein